MEKKNVKILKIILLILTIILITSATIYLIPIMKSIATPYGKIEFKQKIDDAGIFGMLILFALQIAQIFLIIFPGEPLEIIAGMCYGTVGGSIFVFVTVFITTTALFYLVKKYGKKFIYQFFSEERIDKIENSKTFKNPKNIELIFTILFLIPGTPKDLLVYIGGLFPVKPIRFILISTFARFPSVISSTIAGDYIVKGNWKISIIAYVITFVITAIMVIIANKLDKNKLTEEAINTIK